MDRFIAIDKTANRLYTYWLDKETGRFERRANVPVSIGLPQYETPSGLFKVGDSALNPDWRMPDSEWVPVKLRNTVIPGGSVDNPLKGAFLDLGFLGVGIHGTAETWMLGQPASHGCIRVTPEFAIKLYHKFKEGSPVYIYGETRLPATKKKK